MNVCIIGLGYIGLPTAAIISSSGKKVIGVDINEEIINKVNSGCVHITEPDLESLVKEEVKKGNLVATMTPNFADIFIITVPTPLLNNENEIKDNQVPQPDLDYVFSAINDISEFIRPGNLIILESTSPVGTTEKLIKILENNGVETKEIHLAYSPERVIPGNILFELKNNGRVVGGINDISTKKAAEFYRTFVQGEIIETNSRTAEMTKLTENAFRDINIAFANELSMLCNDLDINVNELIELANKHPRVNILKPGCGVGGHCIAVDPWFIVNQARKNSALIEQGRKTNLSKSNWVIQEIKNKAQDFKKSEGRNPVITCMGLAYKPDINDLRESPALFITEELIKAGLDILAVEPNLSSHKNITLIKNEDVAQKADIVVFLVAHKEFIQIKNKINLDFCGVIE